MLDFQSREIQLLENRNLVGGNRKSKTVSLNARVFFFCLNVKILVKFMATIKVEMEIYETQHLMVQPKPRLLQKEKYLMQLVESLHLSTMATSYNLHFVAYNTSKKHVTQLIPTIVWKQIYINYQKTYL
jgi:hypothetical protein